MLWAGAEWVIFIFVSKVELVFDSLVVGHEKALFTIDTTICGPSLVGLLGRNGSGKSSLLKTIAGITDPFEGKIFFDGIDLLNIDPLERARIVSISLSEVYPYLKVQELVALARTPYTDFFNTLSTKDRNVIERSLITFGAYSLKDREFGSLSDGEKQKVILAKTFAQDTPLVLLDEPEVHLDLPSRNMLFNALRKYSKYKLVLVATHDLSIARGMDRWIILQDSTVVEGEPENIIVSQMFQTLFSYKVQDVQEIQSYTRE